MGFKDQILSIMTDFVEQKRNPEFRSKSDLSAKSEVDYPPNFQPKLRRHSLNITCGTESPDDKNIRQRAFSVRAPQMRRNTIMPEAPANTKTPSSPANETAELANNVGRTARRFSEPLNARFQEFQPAPVKRIANRSLLSDRPQLSSEESDSDSNSERHTPATSPRAFQNSFEKRNNRFFAGPSSWRTSALLDESPIEEGEEEDEPVEIYQEPSRKTTIIKITASPCN